MARPWEIATQQETDSVAPTVGGNKPWEVAAREEAAIEASQDSANRPSLLERNLRRFALNAANTARNETVRGVENQLYGGPNLFDVLQAPATPVATGLKFIQEGIRRVVPDLDQQYEDLPSFTEEPSLGEKILGGFSALTGSLVGSAPSEEAFIGPATAAGRNIALRIASASGRNAAVEAPIDAVIQGANIELGKQDDYSVEQGISSVALAGLLGGIGRGGVELRNFIGAKKGKPPKDVTPEDITPEIVDEVNSNPDLVRILEANNALDANPEAREILAARLERRRQQEAERLGTPEATRPLEAGDLDRETAGLSPAAAARLRRRQARIDDSVANRDKAPREAVALQNEREAEIELDRKALEARITELESEGLDRPSAVAQARQEFSFEVDPGASARQGRPDYTTGATEGEAAIAAVLRRPLPDPAEGGRGPIRLGQRDEAGNVVIPDRAPDQGTQAGFDRSVEIKAENDRAASLAFKLAQRQRERSNIPGARDDKPGGLPRGVVRQDVDLHNGRPVEILGPGDTRGTVKVQRLRPDAENLDGPRVPDPDSIPYDVDPATIYRAQRSPEPRRAQDFEARAKTNKGTAGAGPEEPRLARDPRNPDPAQRGGSPDPSPRAGGLGREPRQTFRRTAPDPNEDFPAAGDGRSPVPPQRGDGGPNANQFRWRSPEEAAEEFRQRQRARQEEAARALAEQRQQRVDPGEQARSQAEQKYKGAGFSPKARKINPDGTPETDEFGFVVSDKGGPVKYGDQKQAARAILNLQKDTPDGHPGFEIENHPSGDGFTIRQRDGQANGNGSAKNGAEGEGANADDSGRSGGDAGSEGQARSGDGVDAEGAANGDKTSGAGSGPDADEVPPGGVDGDAGSGGASQKGKKQAGDEGASKGPQKKPQSKEPDPEEYRDDFDDFAARAHAANAQSADDLNAEAVKWTLEKGADGNEHSVNYTSDGEILSAGTSGSPIRAFLSGSVLERRWVPGAGIHNVHNHPSGAAPSHTDIRLIFTPGVDKLTVSTNDGVFVITPRKEAKDALLEGAKTKAGYDFAITVAWTEIGSVVSQIQERMWGAIHAGRLSLDDAKAHFSHIVADIFHEAGIIDYRPRDGYLDTVSGSVARLQEKLRAAFIPELREIFKLEGGNAKSNYSADEKFGGASESFRADGGSEGLRAGNAQDEGSGSPRSSRGPDRGPAPDEKTDQLRSLGSKFYSNPLADPELMGHMAESIFGFSEAASTSIRNSLKSAASALATVSGEPLKTAAFFKRAIFFSTEARIRAVGQKFNSKTAHQIADMFHAVAGRGNDTGMTYHSEIDTRMNFRLNTLKDILTPLGEGKGADIKNSMELVSKFVRNPRLIRKKNKIGEAADKIEKFLREELKYLREAGVEVGEVMHGYLPRLLDDAKVLANPDKFRQAAQATFRKMGMSKDEAFEAADQWLLRLQGIDPTGKGDFAGIAGAALPNFTKGRKLPDDVDKSGPLAEFYMTDLNEVLGQYVAGGTRRAAWVRRFGGDKWSKMKQALVSEGVDDSGLREIVMMIRANTGQNFGDTHKLWRSAMGWAGVWNTIGLLDRATLSSIQEIVMPAIRSGRPRDMAAALQIAVGDMARGLTKSGSAEARREFAQDIGFIAKSIEGAMMNLRFAEFDSSSKTQAKVLDTYFRRIGLEQLTQATRVASTDIGRRHIRRLFRDFQTGKTPKLTEMHLSELGIKKDDIPALKKLMKEDNDFMPGADEIHSGGKAGEIYTAALARFIDQSVMRPNSAQRPNWATTPSGKVVFALQGFLWSFHKNVMVRSLNLAKQGVAGKDFNAIERAQLLGQAALPVVLLPIALGIGEVRDMVFGDPIRRKQETREEKVIKAFSRGGFLGTFDQMVNQFTGIRYNRSVAQTGMGPLAGRVADAVDTTGRYWLRNSENTNTAERSMAKTIYDVGIEPAINLALTGLGPASPVAALATQGVGAGWSREQFVTWAAGEPSARRGGASGSDRGSSRSSRDSGGSRSSRD